MIRNQKFTNYEKLFAFVLSKLFDQLYISFFSITLLKYKESVRYNFFVKLNIKNALPETFDQVRTKHSI